MHVCRNATTEGKGLVDRSEKALECSSCPSDLQKLWPTVERHCLDEEKEAGMVKEGMEGEGEREGRFCVMWKIFRTLNIISISSVLTIRTLDGHSVKGNLLDRESNRMLIGNEH